MTKLISITEHKSNYPTPITFSFGDTVTLGKLDTEYAGWIRVTTFDGNVGWAQSSISTLKWDLQLV